MSKTILTAVGFALIAVSTVQFAAATEHHHAAPKAASATVSEQVRNANNSIAAPALPSYYSGGYSAPAGR